jgi:hypothetical protein
VNQFLALSVILPKSCGGQGLIETVVEPLAQLVQGCQSAVAPGDAIVSPSRLTNVLVAYDLQTNLFSTAGVSNPAETYSSRNKWETRKLKRGHALSTKTCQLTTTLAIRRIASEHWNHR